MIVSPILSPPGSTWSDPDNGAPSTRSDGQNLWFQRNLHGHLTLIWKRLVPRWMISGRKCGAYLEFLLGACTLLKWKCLVREHLQLLDLEEGMSTKIWQVPNKSKAMAKVFARKSGEH